jgi:pimeloyl-ACP methyl ester carboxylesterase
MKIDRLLILLLLAASPIFVSAQQPSFDVQRSGVASGPAILFIPGFACSGQVWKETVARYKDRYNCFVFTMPGFAGIAPETQPSLTGWVDELASYIQAKHLVKPIIIGHSIGGCLTLMLAARYPELIGRIVAVDALPCVSAMTNQQFKATANPDCGPMIDGTVKASDSEFYSLQRTIMKQTLADTTHEAEVIHWSMISDRKTLGAIYCQFTNTDLRDALSAIRCPALILLEQRFAGMRPVIEGQYAKLTTAKFVYSTKGLHFIMYDDPDWYFGQLDGVLNRGKQLN